MSVSLQLQDLLALVRGDLTRVDAKVRLHDGSDAAAWIYVFRASTEDALRIDSGDWVQATTSAKP